MANWWQTCGKLVANWWQTGGKLLANCWQTAGKLLAFGKTKQTVNYSAPTDYRLQERIQEQYAMQETRATWTRRSLDGLAPKVCAAVVFFSLFVWAMGLITNNGSHHMLGEITVPHLTVTNTITVYNYNMHWIKSEHTNASFSFKLSHHIHGHEQHNQIQNWRNDLILNQISRWYDTARLSFSFKLKHVGIILSTEIRFARLPFGQITARV